MVKNCINLKACSKCGIEKEFTSEYFPIRYSRKVKSLRVECKDCWNNRHRNYKSKESVIKKKTPKKVISCNVCGCAFESHQKAKCCSDECRKEYNCLIALYKAILNFIPKRCTCVECGKVYFTEYGDKNRGLYCSDNCTKKRNRRIAKALRRARMRGSNYESIDPFSIFDRDSWTCQICGVNTPYELRGTYEDNAPELDHIFPLSKGGEHNLKNTQCLCRKCNQTKSDNLEYISNKMVAL